MKIACQMHIPAVITLQTTIQLCYHSERSILKGSVQDNLSEWLRRQTRNLLGFARAGSNPAVVVFLFFILFFFSLSTFQSLFTLAFVNKQTLDRLIGIYEEKECPPRPCARTLSGSPRRCMSCGRHVAGAGFARPYRGKQ